MRRADLIERHAKAFPGVLALAQAASLAVTVKHPFALALRDELKLPTTDADLETFFPDLIERERRRYPNLFVGSSSVDTAVLDVSVLPMLWEGLLKSGIVEKAWAITEARADRPRAYAIEERLKWFALTKPGTEGDRLIEEELGAALAWLREQRPGEKGVAWWLNRALPVMPRRARQTALAATLRDEAWTVAGGVDSGWPPAKLDEAYP